MSEVASAGRVSLIAPLTGIMMPIEQVPDPVFAKKMVGEGFSIDPLNGHNNAKSLLTQVVVTNSERIANVTPTTGLVTAGQDVAAEFELAAPQDAEADATGGRTHSSGAILVPNPTGLHARPAATLVSLAKKYSADIRLRRGDDSANAKSIVSIMGMAVARADKVTITAHGKDAEEAIEELSKAIVDGLGEDCPPLPSGAEETETISDATDVMVDETVEAAGPLSGDPNLLLGIAASPGLGVGTVVQIHHDDIAVDEFADDHHQERRKLNAAIDRALLDLSALEKRLEKESSPDKAAIFAAHQEILGDPDLLDLAVSAIDKGKSAPFAWRGAFNTFADQLAGLNNEILAGRANDVRDVGQRVLEELTGQRSEKPELPEGTVLIAEDLTPSDTAQLDRTKVVGFATTAGGASSHVAIIARSLDIPAVAGVEGRALDIADGERVVLDGTKGTLQVNVTPPTATTS